MSNFNNESRVTGFTVSEDAAESQNLGYSRYDIGQDDAQPQPILKSALSIYAAQLVALILLSL